MATLRSTALQFAALAVAGVVTAPAWAASAVVYGNANPNLAGRDAGYACCSGDVAPDQSPTLVTGLALNTGDILNFAVTGEVSHVGGASGGNNPDGTPFSGLMSNYGDGISAPSVGRIDGLVGVFLGATSPTGAPTPAALDFSGGLDFASLAPLVGQIFFIGDGRTSDSYSGGPPGAVQSFIVPAGATRLYLGTSDGDSWYNNNGSFQVEVSALVPEPASWALMALGVAGLAACLRRRGNRPVSG